MAGLTLLSHVHQSAMVFSAPYSKTTLLPPLQTQPCLTMDPTMPRYGPNHCKEHNIGEAQQT